MTVMSDSTALDGMEPTEKINVRKVFGLDTDMVVHGFKTRTEYVPEIDDAYRFDPQTTLAILAGFEHNRRVMVQGYHGTGNRPTSSRWPRASTGRASGSTSTAMSAVSIWSARTRSS